jgi:hypothetical protein
VSEELVKFVSARQWRKAQQEAQEEAGPEALLDPPIAPEGLGVRLGFNAEVETLTKAALPKPEGRQMLIAISSESVDRDTDTIAVDGWKLEQYRKNPVVLFGHKYFNNDAPVVGRSLAEFVHKKKLKSLMEFTPQGMVPLADTLYGLYSEGYMSAASVGFIPLDWKYPEGDPAREWGIDFLEQELLEYSLVTVPANADALSESMAEARGKGIETMPLSEWSTDVMDAWGKNKERNLWIPKSALKALRDAADPRQPTSAQVPADVSKPEAPGEPPESGQSGIQTLLFEKAHWTEDAAKAWLAEHEFHNSAVDETDELYRFRQFDPEACDPDSYVTLTENFPAGVSAVSCTAKACEASKVATIGVEVQLSPEAAEALKVLQDAERLAGTAQGDALDAVVRMTDEEMSGVVEEIVTATDWTIERIGDVCSATGTTTTTTTRTPADEPEPEGDRITLTDEQEEALSVLGLNLNKLGTGDDDDDETLVIVGDDGDGSEERSQSDLAREILGEIIGEDVGAALTHALGGKEHGA